MHVTCETITLYAKNETKKVESELKVTDKREKVTLSDCGTVYLEW